MMSMPNSYISNYIKKSNSIWKIIDKAIFDKDFYDEMNKCSVTKYIQPFNIIFKLTVYKSINGNVIEWKLFSCYGEKFPSTDTLTPWIFSNRKNTDFEVQTNIIIENTADLSMEKDSVKFILAQKSGISIKNLFKRFRFASKLIIYNQKKDKEIVDDFILLIIEKIKTKNLKYLGPISLYIILSFISKYDISEHDIFKGKPNLKEFTIYVEYSKIFNNNLLIDSKFWRFIDNITQNNIQLKLTFDQNEKSIFLTVTILNYCKRRNINVFIDVEKDKLLFFSYIKKDIIQKNYEIIKNLSSITLVINQFEDLENIKYIFTEMSNLKEVIIIFNRTIYPKLTKTDKKLEFLSKFYHKTFDFKTQIKKLKSFILNYHDNYFPVFFETFNLQEKLYDTFIISILSILPNSLNEIQFISMPYLKEEYFNCLYKNSPNISRCIFKHCHYIPDDALLLFKNLRSILLIDNIGITIPSWIEIVIYKDFNAFMCENNFFPCFKKNKSRLFKFMKNSTFQNTFWIYDNHIPDTVIFMKDLMKWTDAIELLYL
ncbi:Hypothetical protein SRAE_1000311400 [Strongyloides ratti]|uniref:Uncharacterized protein n=1 Tax=Strongyloides ratti TaxID=34506 RepID=A0A090L4Y4_STRRB|nr:Hypothetical protein SRAE_1000311400 [Strongyloides ratti]CEF64861.1 Hypothetical protein SRAE_1000311400 [Strongyloides ratti]